MDVYSGLDWSAGYHSGEVVEAPLRTLDHFLTTVGVLPGFEVLVIDVEGLEWEVLLGFSALRWRPLVVIVEIEDTHESFRSIDFLQARVPHPRCAAHGSFTLVVAYVSGRAVGASAVPVV